MAQARRTFENRVTPLSTNPAILPVLRLSLALGLLLTGRVGA